MKPIARRLRGAAWALLCGAALAALASAAAPAAYASPRAAADRAYPVLVDGRSASGAGKLTVFGPAWTASLKLKDPGPIAVTPNGKYAYVATAGGLAVIARVNTAHPRLAGTVKTGGTPAGDAVTSDGAEVYVTVSSAKRSLVKAYSGASTGKLKFQASVATKPGANAIAVTPDGKYAYLAVNDVPYIYYLTEIGGIGTGHLRVLRNISLAGYPEDVTVTPNGQYVYEVSNMGLYGGISAFKHAQSAHPVASFGFAPSSQGGVGSVTVTPDGRWAYAAHGRSLIVIKNAQTGPRRDGTVKVSPADGQLVIQPDGRYALEAADTAGGGSITVLTGTSAGHPKVTSTWKLSYYPYYLAISPDR